MTAQKGSMLGRVHSALPTSLGELTVVREGRAVTGLYFPRHWPRPDRTAFGARAEDGFADIASQLREYLAGTRIAFDLPILIHGTDFDRRFGNWSAAYPTGRRPRMAISHAAWERRRTRGMSGRQSAVTRFVSSFPVTV